MALSVFAREPVAGATSGVHVDVLGDPDDHLRLTVLLADRALGKDPSLDVAQQCLRARTWKTRLNLFRSLLESPALRGVIVHDIDALWQGRVQGPARWNDSTFRRERADLFDLLIDAAAALDWTLERPARNPRLDDAVESLRPASIRPDDTLNGVYVIPEVRPIARALLHKGVRTEQRLAEEIRAAEELNSDPVVHVIGLSDERLSEGARDTALRLSLLRTALDANGTVGPYVVFDGEVRQLPGAAVQAVSANSLTELLDTGLVIQNGGQVRMPRTVRQYFRTISEETRSLEVRAEHTWLVEHYGNGVLANTIERHHHAVESENVDVVLKAEHYVQDARLLATRISRRGGPSNRLRAASIFKDLLAIDDEDAYAWEYYGWNLARGADAESRDEVLVAYQNACKHDPDNPLYEGRLIGWRGQWGEYVVNEARHRILELGPESVAAGWFAVQVVRGLERGRQRGQIERLESEVGEDRIEEWRKPHGS